MHDRCYTTTLVVTLTLGLFLFIQGAVAKPYVDDSEICQLVYVGQNLSFKDDLRKYFVGGYAQQGVYVNQFEYTAGYFVYTSYDDAKKLYYFSVYGIIGLVCSLLDVDDADVGRIVHDAAADAP